MLTYDKGHNPYFNRWFSAISSPMQGRYGPSSHNPYFNRWFSAMKIYLIIELKYVASQSLF